MRATRTRASLRSDTSELRRLRIGFEAEWRWLAVEVDVDPQDDGDELKDLYWTWAPARRSTCAAGTSRCR